LTSPTRAQVLHQLAEAVLERRASRPTLVAIDGRSAAGKSTLGDELSTILRSQGKNVLRASIDDFHRPGHKYRSQHGEWTPERYFDEGYDYEAFLAVLLRPLTEDRSRRCRLGIFDSYRDEPLPEVWHTVSTDGIVLVDGVFLLRPELAGYWDYVIWVDIDWETMIERACRRDVAWVGSEEVVRERYRRHWIPTHELYEGLVDPRDRAHAMIDNRDIERPHVIRL
jgi:uridine kinase